MRKFLFNYSEVFIFSEAKLSLRVTKVTDENLTYKTEDHRVTVLCDSSGKREREREREAVA